MALLSIICRNFQLVETLISSTYQYSAFRQIHILDFFFNWEWGKTMSLSYTVEP